MGGKTPAGKEAPGAGHSLLLWAMAAAGIDRASGRALGANQTVARSNATVSGQVASAHLKVAPGELAGKGTKGVVAEQGR